MIAIASTSLISAACEISWSGSGPSNIDVIDRCASCASVRQSLSCGISIYWGYARVFIHAQMQYKMGFFLNTFEQFLAIDLEIAGVAALFTRRVSVSNGRLEAVFVLLRC